MNNLQPDMLWHRTQGVGQFTIHNNDVISEVKAKDNGDDIWLALIKGILGRGYLENC